MSTMDSAVTLGMTGRRGWIGVRRARAVAGLMVLVALGLMLGASLLFARPYVPADSNAAGHGHGTRATETPTPGDPRC